MKAASNGDGDWVRYRQNLRGWDGNRMCEDGWERGPAAVPVLVSSLIVLTPAFKLPVTLSPSVYLSQLLFGMWL